jgi:hypothetical protein
MLSYYPGIWTFARGQMDGKYIVFLAVAVTHKVQFSVLDYTEGGSDMLW